jgi:hypothetical protein
LLKFIFPNSLLPNKFFKFLRADTKERRHYF